MASLKSINIVFQVGKYTQQLTLFLGWIQVAYSFHPHFDDPMLAQLYHKMFMLRLILLFLLH